jgi:hypothetical protein
MSNSSPAAFAAELSGQQHKIYSQGHHHPYERMIASNTVTVATMNSCHTNAALTTATSQSSPSAQPLGSASSSLSSSSCSSSSYSIMNQEAAANAAAANSTNTLNHHHHFMTGCNNSNTLLKSSQHNLHHLYEKENDSGIEKDDSASNSNTSASGGDAIFIRISITDQNLQKVLKFSLDEVVWTAKQRVLGTLAKEVKDGLNYGFYLPPFQGRAGKFLDDCRKLREYPLNGQIPNLEVTIKQK